MPRITPVQIALGVGAAGAMVDVSAYADFGAGVSRSWGRSDEFDSSTSPGQFSFTLDNYDGRFTPDNPASALVTKLSEGCAVSWMLGTRLVAGTVESISPVFPGGESAWAQVEVSCVDMLAGAARNELGPLVDSINAAAGPMRMWRMDEDEGSSLALEAHDPAALEIVSNSINPSYVFFGNRIDPGLPGTGALLVSNAATGYFRPQRTLRWLPYPDTTLGHWGFWIIPNPGANLGAVITVEGLDYVVEFGFVSQLGPGTSRYYAFLGNAGLPGAILYDVAPSRDLYSPHYVSIGMGTVFTAGAWVITCTLYVDGVSVGSGPYVQTVPVTVLGNTERQQTIRLEIGDGTNNTSQYVSRLSHTLNLAHEEYAIGKTEAERLLALDASTPELVLDTLPSDLSEATIGLADTDGNSALDGMNDVMDAEQGYIYTATTGTLLAPVQKIKVRARQRPTTVSYSFDAERDLAGAPEFVRDITNMVSTVRVTGTDYEVSVSDVSLVSRVGSASTTEKTLNLYPGDLEAWGQDRLIRGKNANLRVASITVDALTTPTDRSADLLAMVPGDRIRVTNLPTGPLGFTTWDGWLLGGRETHTVESHEFELFFAPVIAGLWPVYDTDRFMADGALTLTAGINSSVTSMSVATTGPKLTTTDVPFALLLDSEQVTVTAVSGATPQVVTMTRAAGGTTAAAHTTAAVIEISPSTYFAF